MKAYLALISTAIALSACSQELRKTCRRHRTGGRFLPPHPAPAAEAPAAAASEAAPAAAADEACSTVVSSDDAMKSDTADINISKPAKPSPSP